MEDKKTPKFIFPGKGIITKEELEKILETEDEKSEQKQYDLLPDEEYVKNTNVHLRRVLLARNKAVEKFIWLVCPYNEEYLKKRMHIYFKINDKMINDLIVCLIQKGTIRRTRKGRLERVE